MVNEKRGGQPPIVDTFRYGINVDVRTPADLLRHGIIVRPGYVQERWGEEAAEQYVLDVAKSIRMENARKEAERTRIIDLILSGHPIRRP